MSLHLTKQRKAIAMIELIFAIVIMGIVMLSAPMIISTATKSGYVALQQESIAAAASEIGMILTYPWDENNTDENLSFPILQTAGDVNLNESIDVDGNLSRVRWGSSRFSKRTFLTSTNERLSASTLGADVGDRDDMDDFIGNSTLSNVEGTTTSTGDYIDNAIVLSTAVVYIADTPTAGNYRNSDPEIRFNLNSTGAAAAGTTNIKKVTLTLTTTNTQREMAKNIILHAFSCNVGTYELEERLY